MHTDNPVKEVKDCVGAGTHEITENVAEEENEDIDDNNTVAFHAEHDFADGVGGDGEQEAGAVERWDWN